MWEALQGEHMTCRGHASRPASRGQAFRIKARRPDARCCVAPSPFSQMLRAPRRSSASDALRRARGRERRVVSRTCLFVLGEGDKKNGFAGLRLLGVADSARLPCRHERFAARMGFPREWQLALHQPGSAALIGDYTQVTITTKRTK